MSRRVLILVENLPSPFDRRVWQEATTLRDAGYLVSIICPTGKGYEKKLRGDRRHRHPALHLPVEAEGALGYAIEYCAALSWTFVLSLRVFFARGFDVIHACNPPDLFFLIGGFFKLFGKKFVFDHHDINPELYEAKFGRRDLFWKLMCLLERLTFRIADVSIATNESYRRIAIERGGMAPERVFVVRSGPSLERLKVVPPVRALKCGKRYLVGYVGVMGRQEGIDLLLHAVRHIVRPAWAHTTSSSGWWAAAPRCEEMQALARRAEHRRLRDLHRPRARRRAAGDAQHGRRLREPRRRQRDERQVDHEQDHGVHGARQADRAVRPRRGPLLGAGGLALREEERPGRFRARRSSSCSTIRRGAHAWARTAAGACENELEWRYEAPKLLAAYDALWAKTAPRPAARHLRCILAGPAGLVLVEGSPRTRSAIPRVNSSA